MGIATATQKRTNKHNGFVYTTAIRRLRKMKKRIRVIPGGTSAGKTFGILPILIDRATKTGGLEISVVSESIPHLKKGAIKDFKKIMQLTGRYVESRWHDTDKKYTFANGSYIEFFSAMDEARCRGPRRNILYVNECNNVHFEAYYQLMIRTDQEIYLDYNPTAEFWVHTEVIPDNPDAEVLKLTYKDNEALSPNIVKELEKNRIKAKTSKYWENWCRVYLDGEIGSLEGVIFQNWEAVKIPTPAILIGYGLDFGYSNDPTALIAVYKYAGAYYFKEEIFETGLTNTKLNKKLKDIGISRTLPIYADSADPKSIDELVEYGWNVQGAKKGADSIKFGIDILQGIKMYIDEESTNIIKELRGYVWATDKTGKSLNEPIKVFNHSIDAMRYFAVMSISMYSQSTAQISYEN